TTAAREQIAHDLEHLARHRAHAADELAAAPSDESVLRAGVVLETAAQAVAETFAACERTAQEVGEKRVARDSAVAARDRDAADLQLSPWLGRLDELAHATSAYDRALVGLWPT